MAALPSPPRENGVQQAQLLSLFFVAFLVARLTLVFAAKMLPSFTLYTVALGGAALAATFGAMVNPAISFIAIGVSAGLFFPSFFVTAARKMGTDPRVPATIVAAGLVGGILSPILMSGLMESLGQRGFFWIIAAIAGATALLA